MIEEKTDSAKIIEEAKEEQKEAQSTKPTMHVKVYSPFKVYFDDTADSISGQNATGPFDILPKHHNFMTLLQPCELVIRTFRGEEKIRISGGLMHVKADQITVFLDI
jgi:F0F1-type ATP synthase epsilon subunit